ncbi:hypothetical protein GW17_00008277 [Ensete ventricosum]|nr:hypothetical protein GW17_00008277 [Ensete ventricosum]
MNREAREEYVGRSLEKDRRLTTRMLEAVGLVGQAMVVPPRPMVVPSPPRNSASMRQLDRPGRWLYRPHPIFRVAFDGCTART